MIAYYRKAWDVVGHTFDGDAYCRECSELLPTCNGAGDAPAPVFASDDVHGLTCRICAEVVQ